MARTQDRRRPPATLVTDDFEAFYQRSYRGNFLLALSITNNHDVSRDVCQAAYLELWLNWHRVQHAPSWSRKAVLHNAIREAVDLRRHSGSPLQDDVPAHLEVSEIELLSLLHGLSDEQREVLVLRYLEDLSIAEIAQLTGRPDGTIKSQISRSLKIIRESLSTGV